VFDEVTLEQKASFSKSPLGTVFCADTETAYGTNQDKGDSKFELLAVQLADGSKLWSISDIGNPGDIVLHSELLYVATEKAPALRVIDCSSGMVRWTAATDQPGTAISVQDRRLYIGTGDGNAENHVHCYDVDTRELIWSERIPGIPNQIFYQDSSLFVTITIDLHSMNEIAGIVKLDSETGERGSLLAHGNRTMGKLGAIGDLLFVPMVERGADDLPGGGMLCLHTRNLREVFRSYFDWTRGIYAIPVGQNVLFSTHSQVGLFDLRKLWSANIGASVRVRPAVAGDQVIVSTSSGDVVSISAAEGRRIWRLDGQGPANAAPTIRYDEGIVYVATGSILHALKIKTGIEIWRYDAGDIIVGYISFRDIGETVVAFGTRGGMVLVLDALSGAPRTVIELGATLTAPVSISDQFVVVGGNDGILSAIDYDSHKVWSFSDIHEIRALVALPGRILVTDAGGNVRAHAYTDGSLLWSTRIGGRIDARGILVIDRSGKFVVVGDDGQVVAMNWQDGSVLWRSASTGAGTRLPAETPEELVLVSDHGRVTCLGREDGIARRSFDLGKSIVSEIGAGDAILVVGDDQGILHRLII
jgi:outer membrane protein assembly factor BamB